MGGNLEITTYHEKHMEDTSKVVIYLIQHPMQLIPCLHNSIPVIAINHKYKTLSVLEVVPPQWTDLFNENYVG
jgi:hypothetical protein